MWNPIKKIKRNIVLKIEGKYKDQFAGSKTIWSQYGEDIVLSWLFLHKKDGFFVDVGAYHPKKLSNTYWFYERGWRGINIEPDIDSVKEFEKYRPLDINLNCGIYSRKSELPYYRFAENNLNTFNELVANEQIQNGKVFLEKVIVPVNRLDNILDTYSEGRELDLLSIDVEGFEIEVLNSNNWERYNPKIVCLEDWNIDVVEYIEKSETHKFMQSLGYKLVSKVIDSCIYSRIHLDRLDKVKE
jgi:FkbM family methyltransferase